MSEGTDQELPESAAPAAASAVHAETTSLKRKASPTFEDRDDGDVHKRVRGEEITVTRQDMQAGDAVSQEHPQFAEDLAQELQCGCCSELLYKPIMVHPCQHVFCGSCCVLWIKNGGSNCPACRQISTSVTPLRPLQAVIDVFLHAYPSFTRAESERTQADEVYKAGATMRIPPPREHSPEPNLNVSTEFARPCPHCAPGNPYGWRCPQPVPDPNLDLDNAWHVEDGSPPGHAYCGNCENLLALDAPSTTTCDLCRVSFCGIHVHGRCVAALLFAQHPHAMNDMGDLIQSAEVYDCFDGNTVEVEIMLDYLSAQGLTPRHIYREIATHLQHQPTGFAPLIALELFADVHNVAPAREGAEPSRQPARICRVCAAEVLLWGLREWWVRERAKGFLEESVLRRPDCAAGGACARQRDMEHAKEFNHIISARSDEPDTEPSRASSSGSQDPSPPPADAPWPTHPHVAVYADFTPTPEMMRAELPSVDGADEPAPAPETRALIPFVAPLVPPAAVPMPLEPSGSSQDAIEALV